MGKTSDPDDRNTFAQTWVPYSPVVIMNVVSGDECHERWTCDVLELSLFALCSECYFDRMNAIRMRFDTAFLFFSVQPAIHSRALAKLLKTDYFVAGVHKIFILWILRM